jgi:hypothetical protein
MSRSNRVLLALPLLLIFVAVCSVLLALAVPLVGCWARDVSGALVDLGQGWVRRQELRAESQATSVRLELRQEIAGRVAQGRLSLLEGAARFRALDREEPPVVQARLYTDYPAGTAEECCCRHLIEWVRAWLEDNPRPDPGIPGRLEAELDEYLRRGTLRLPEA